ncbi:hypothetical protein KJ841_03225 [Patescibacteria group bacterium]|nr:hypothetical protein [Patescibacteria group bacterium]
MAIRIIRICDNCGSEHKQILAIPENLRTVEYEIAFECSDCILKEAHAEETTTGEKPESPQ